jgi:hypothetical protein
MTVDVQRQHLVYEGFTGPDLRGVFTPDRVAIEKRDGEVLAERTAPRESFADHGPDTPWDELHALYFAGYAMWNYLTAPYLLTRPGVVLEEVEPWQEGGVRPGDGSTPPSPRTSPRTTRNRSSTTTPTASCDATTTHPTYSAAPAPRTSPNSTSRRRDWSSPPTGTSCPPRKTDALSRNRS